MAESIYSSTEIPPPVIASTDSSIAGPSDTSNLNLVSLYSDAAPQSYGAAVRDPEQNTAIAAAGDPYTWDGNFELLPYNYGDAASQKQASFSGQGVLGLDRATSVEDLVKQGYLRDQTDSTVSADRQIRDINASPVKDIQFVYTDNTVKDPAQKTKPDFLVRQDGTIEVLSNPDLNNKDKLTVEVERQPGQTGAPPEAQQKAIDALAKYLCGRYMKDAPAADGSPGKEGIIEDPQGLVSDEAKKGIGTQPSAEQQLPEAARRQTEDTNRWDGASNSAGGRGPRFTPQEASDFFPPRDVPRQPNEDDKLAAIKDIAAGFATKGEKEPYLAVKPHGSQGWGVGRYGLTADSFMSWLDGLSDAEIERLIKEGKLPKGALDLKHRKKSPDADKLEKFLDKMKGGKEEISANELKEFFPKESQEAIATGMVQKYAAETADRDPNTGAPARVNIGKVALSMTLGHTASDADAARPENQALMQAAEKQYPLALQHQMDGTANIDLSDAARKIVSAAIADQGQRKWLNHASETEYGNLGCAASVSAVLRDAGVANIDQLSVYGLDQSLQAQGWKRVSVAGRQPGDVIIGYRQPPENSSGGSAHTGIVGENINIAYNNHSNTGQWSKDPFGAFNQDEYPAGLYVLRPPAA